MLERRRVLQFIVAGAASSLIPAGIFTITHGQIDAPYPGYSLHDKFAAMLGSRFRMTNADGVTSAATIVAVDEGPRYQGLDQFSVVFEGDGLSEGLYEVWHRDTGRLPISLMSSGESSTGRVRQRAYFSILV